MCLNGTAHGYTEEKCTHTISHFHRQRFDVLFYYSILKIILCSIYVYFYVFFPTHHVYVIGSYMCHHVTTCLTCHVCHFLQMTITFHSSAVSFRSCNPSGNFSNQFFARFVSYLPFQVFTVMCQVVRQLQYDSSLQIFSPGFNDHFNVSAP